MKNIFVALAFFAVIGVNAQTKQKNAQVALQTETVSQTLTPDQAAENDMKALSTVITINESVKADLNKLFVTKHRALQDSSLSTDRLAALNAYVENSLLNFIGETNFAKVKSNSKLFKQLVK